MDTDPAGRQLASIADRLERGEDVDLDETLDLTEKSLAALRERINKFHARADKVRTSGFYTRKELRDLEGALKEGERLRTMLVQLKQSRDSSGASREVQAAEPMGIPPSPSLPDLSLPLNPTSFVVVEGAGKHFIGVWRAQITVGIHVPSKGQTYEAVASAESVAQLLVEAEGLDPELVKVSPAAAIAKLFMQG